jgi:hypothetical protein
MEKPNSWPKVLIPILVYVLGFAVLWGSSQARLASVEQEIGRKADAAVVEANQRAIIMRLDRLTDQMERHLEQASARR